MKTQSRALLLVLVLPLSISLSSSILAVSSSNEHQASVGKTADAPKAANLLERLARQTRPANDDDGGSEEPRQSELGAANEPFEYHSSMPVITKRDLANALKQATQSVQNLRDFTEPALVASQQQVVSPSDSLTQLTGSIFQKRALDWRSLNQTYQALISEETTRLLARDHKLTWLQVLRGLPLISVDQTNLGKLCPKPARQFGCPAGRYRSLSGHCNNVQNADWGAANTPLVRYAPPSYADHISEPIKASKTSGAISKPAPGRHLLPSSRAVSAAIFEATMSRPSEAAPATTPLGAAAPSGLHPHLTTMLSFFGQFLFHDLAQIGQYASLMNGERWVPIKCCQQQQQVQHPECYPIELNGYCLDYTRSVASIRAGCNLGPRDQMNFVSSYLDGSTIYGASEDQMRRLRTFSGGRLRSQLVPASQTSGAAGQLLEMLPLISANLTASDSTWSLAVQDCLLMTQLKSQARLQQRLAVPSGAGCFEAGDLRANENIGLTLMHTIWLREHNYIAGKLAELNKHWQDERLFEEARRIVIAQLQHITYSEFLPAILGRDVMQRFNLSTLGQGYSSGYDPQVNAGTSNELATAVFPFILSTLPAALERYSERLEMIGGTQLVDTFMDPSDLLRRNRFSQYLMGMISQNAMEPALGLAPMSQKMDRMLSELGSPSSANRTRRKAAIEPPQVDLIALTLQQGRDHGLRGYAYWRQACQLKPTMNTWQDLDQVMPANLVVKLRKVYANVQQVDLYLALFERPLAGASVGPTLVCLLARQFYQLKHGDRFWYENDLPAGSGGFTSSQLDEIRQSSLAKLMCRNGQSALNFIQPAPMLASDPYLNAYQYCSNKAMTSFDLSDWREPFTSAKQLTEEQLMNQLGELQRLDLAASEPTSAEVSYDVEPATEGRPQAQLGPAGARSKRSSWSSSPPVSLPSAQQVAASLERAANKLEELAYEQTKRSRRATATSPPPHAAYRYLGRPKRQTLEINNQSLIFELATNELVRSLLHQGKDRESMQSIESDIRELLNSLESVQLENLLANSVESQKFSDFVSSAGGAFLTPEQRTRLIQNNDPTFGPDPLSESSAVATSQTSSSPNRPDCQDDERRFPCDHTSPFRTITGWCNNLNNPKFGQSFTQHDRLLANAYEDGLSVARQSSVVVASQASGRRLALPSARLISTRMHDDKSRLHMRYSLALMQFGQFAVDHDLTRTPFSVAIDGSLLDCSNCDSRKTVHRDCLPIAVPSDDGHFHSQEANQATGGSGGGGGGKKCLHFVRSLNGQTGLGPRQQINALTSYFDGSEIYGSDNCEAKSLRQFQAGRLNSTSYFVQTSLASGQKAPKEILPVTRANLECVTPNGLCFHAGDQRASEQPGLTAMHTTFLRLHNSIVGQLAQINKHWQDEQLYQVGRKIVGAILQRITYAEFVPRLLGLDYVSKYDLLLKEAGYSQDYDPSCSASVLNEFSAAAFRMGHSLIRAAFPLLDSKYKTIGKAFQLRKAFFNSQRIFTEPHLIDAILRGIVSTPVETLDNSVTEELTNHLFEKPRQPFSGMDLVSLNIQRARDHGVAGYNKYRVKCNLTRARTFQELASEIPDELIRRLEGLYAHVDDIDLFTGGMSELPVHGGIIGPTLGCIISLQMQRLKRCDRFWHETSDPWLRFNPSQLAEIRKITLAKVICQQSDSIDSIQRQAMDISDNYLNPRVSCSSLPTMDLSAWRENQKTCQVEVTPTSGSGKKTIVKLETGSSKRVQPCRSCTCTLEGPICRSVKINCLKAMKRPNLAQIMADKWCLVQCSWALEMHPPAG